MGGVSYGQNTSNRYPVSIQASYEPDINPDDIYIDTDIPNDVAIKNMIGINEGKRRIVGRYL